MKIAEPDLASSRTGSGPLSLKLGLLLLLSALTAPPALAQEPWLLLPEVSHQPGHRGPASTGLLQGWSPSPGLSITTGDLKIDLEGYVQWDFRPYRNWNAGAAEPTLRKYNDLLEPRRLRIGFEAEWRWLFIEVDLDPEDDDQDYLRDAYADVTIGKGLILRGGHFELPVSAEPLTSASKIDFMERALLATLLAPEPDVGIMAYGQPLDWLFYQAGLFAGDNMTGRERAGVTQAVRLVAQPLLHTPFRDLLEMGVSVSHGSVEPDSQGRATGFQGESPSGFEFYDRRFVNGDRQRIGLEAALTQGPGRLRAEVLHTSEERTGQGAAGEDLPDEIARGWALSGTWLLTGEKKLPHIIPKRPYPQGFGAVELGLRYEELSFDEDGGPGTSDGTQKRDPDILRASNRILTGGVSWWPVNGIRVMTNVLLERFEGDRLPEEGRRGTYLSWLWRVQFQLP